MKGIAGILCFDGTTDARAILSPVVEKLSAGHLRSSWATFHGGALAQLGVPDGGSARPGFSTAVLDGWIHNAPELCRALGQHVPAGDDARLAGMAYEAWGAAAPGRIEGDFSCAVWDGSAAELHCFVDAVASRPLYYTRNAHFFAFASSEECLLALPGMVAKPKEDMVAATLVRELRDVVPEDAWIAGIHAVPAGSVVTVSRESVAIGKYWEWQLQDEYRFSSDGEAEEAFRERFSVAVARRLRPGRFGLMLSGGMDSAAVRATLDVLGVGATAYRTYSFVSEPGVACVESDAIRALTATNDAVHLPVRREPEGAMQHDMRDFVERGHPRDSALLIPAMLCLSAQRDGIASMLHGVSGDATLWAPDRYIAYLLRSGRWADAWRECTLAGTNNNFLLGRPPARLLAQNAWTAWAPSPIKSTAHRFARRSTSPALAMPLQPEFAARMRIGERLALKRERETKSRQLAAHPGAEYLRTLTAPYGIALGAGAYARLGRRFGVDLSDPWCDRSLINFFQRLPVRYKVRDGWTKHIVRASLAGYAPPSVLWRRGKEHLGGELSESFMEANREWVLDMLSNLDAIEPYIDTRQVGQAVMRFANARERRGDEMSLIRHMLYELLAMLQWLRRLPCL